jgi:hypothetical protein
MGTSEEARAKMEKFQQSFKTEQIDKFLAKNQLMATGIRATQGRLPPYPLRPPDYNGKYNSLSRRG